MRVAQVCPPQACVRATWVVGVGVAIPPRIKVAPTHGGEHRAVLLKLMQQRVLHGLRVLLEFRAFVAEDGEVVAHAHGRRGRVLPLRAGSLRGEAHAQEPRAVPEDVLVFLQQAPLGRGPEHRCQGGALARGLWVDVREHVPELGVRGDRARVVHAVVALPIAPRSGGIGVRILSVEAIHLPNEPSSLRLHVCIPKHSRERIHVDVVLRRAVLALPARKPAHKTSECVLALRLCGERSQQRSRHGRIACLPTCCCETGIRHSDPSIVSGVDVPIDWRARRCVGCVQQV
mmetsp:Transcript_33320/g.84853  ORF Transcript_33320/g.84853 Transcript_33320/m.84853 type:complete len:288 (+) Transcript_33320:229-1092(+)